MPSKLAKKISHSVWGDVGLEAEVEKVAAQLDEVLMPVREALFKADHVLRVYGYNLERKELRPVLEDLEIK